MFKGQLNPKPKLSIFGPLSPNYRHFFEKYDDYLEPNCLKNFKNSIKIVLCVCVHVSIKILVFIGPAVFELLLIKIFKMLFRSRNAWPTKIQNAYHISKKY